MSLLSPKNFLSGANRFPDRTSFTRGERPLIPMSQVFQSESLSGSLRAPSTLPKCTSHSFLLFTFFFQFGPMPGFFPSRPTVPPPQRMVPPCFWRPFFFLAPFRTFSPRELSLCFFLSFFPEHREVIPRMSFQDFSPSPEIGVEKNGTLFFTYYYSLPPSIPPSYARQNCLEIVQVIPPPSG